MKRLILPVVGVFAILFGSWLWLSVGAGGVGDSVSPADLVTIGGGGSQSASVDQRTDIEPTGVDRRSSALRSALVRSRRLEVPLADCDVEFTRHAEEVLRLKTSDNGTLHLPTAETLGSESLEARLERAGVENWPLTVPEGWPGGGVDRHLVCDLVSAIVEWDSPEASNVQAAFFSAETGALPAVPVAVEVLAPGSTVVRVDERALPDGELPGDFRLFLRFDSRETQRVGITEFDLPRLQSLRPASVTWSETGELTVDAALCFDGDLGRNRTKGLSIGFEGRLAGKEEPLPPSVLRWFLFEALAHEHGTVPGRWTFAGFPVGEDWTCVLRVAGHGQFEERFTVEPRRETDLSFCSGNGVGTAYVSICPDLVGEHADDERWRKFWTAWTESPPLELNSYDADGRLVGFRILGKRSGVVPPPDEIGRWEVPVALDGPSKLVLRDWRSPRMRMQPSVFTAVSPGDTLETCPIPFPSGQFCIVKLQCASDPFETVNGPLTLFLVRVQSDDSACFGDSLRVTAYRVESPAELERRWLVPADGLVSWCVTAAGTSGAAGPADVRWGSGGRASDAYFGTMLVEFELTPGQGCLAVSRQIASSEVAADRGPSADELVASWVNSMPDDLKLTVFGEPGALDMQAEGRAMLFSAGLKRASIGWCGVRGVKYFLGPDRLPCYELAPGLVLVHTEETARIEDLRARQAGFRSVPVRLVGELKVLYAEFELD